MRAAVLGSPIAHSLSPVLHRAAYAELGLDWEYSAIECSEAEFPEWFAALDEGWAGLSLTMPLKQVVIPLLDRVTPLAASAGAVNTVTFADDARVGDNTDVHGIVEALHEGGADRPKRALVLGAGATARSAVVALGRLGVAELAVLSRSRDRAADVLALAADTGLSARWEPLDTFGRSDADAVVCTLPGGAADALADDLPSPPGMLLDVAYHPWPTRLARAWRDAGGVAVGGFSMLLHQAARQVTLMTGLDAPLEAMRAAGVGELRARG
jgi:shikimate dehydrogenase